jgi:hypothetical protein
LLIDFRKMRFLNALGNVRCTTSVEMSVHAAVAAANVTTEPSWIVQSALGTSGRIGGRGHLGQAIDPFAMTVVYQFYDSRCLYGRSACCQIARKTHKSGRKHVAFRGWTPPRRHTMLRETVPSHAAQNRTVHESALNWGP